MDNSRIETTKPSLVDEVKKSNKKSSLVLNIILGICFLSIILYSVASAPSRERDATIHISSSDSLSKISDVLETKKVVKSKFLLKVLVYAFSGDRYISKGDYLFKKNASLISVSWQLSRGIHGVSPIRVTFKEGFTRENMAEILSDKISNFRKDLFLSDPRSKEGYMFPDTYFFYPLSTTDEILDEITSNFNKRILSLDKEIKLSKKSLSDIIIMASILEKEANGQSDAYEISGILWRRTELGMPLQVDAAPITYSKKGLPDSPISNPGILSIKAALSPSESDYLFYLHDKNRQVHYAVDFSEHKSNIAKYLK